MSTRKPAPRGQRADYFRRYKEEHRDRRRAHKQVARALAAGKIIRPLRCQKCRTPCRAQAHHEDYSKPLEIIWLCKTCHMRRHAQIDGFADAPLDRD